MASLYPYIAAIAAQHASVVSIDQMDAAGVSRAVRARWVASGLLQRLGPRSFLCAGAVPSFESMCHAGSFDLRGSGAVAGRAAARLYRLDGFADAPAEFVVPRAQRGSRCPQRVVSTSQPLPSHDVRRIAGLRVVSPERLILDAPLFTFSRREIEDAIDSALRMRLMSENRLVERVQAAHRSGVNHSRLLIDALVDSGGESQLERMMLRLARLAGLDRPATQRTIKDGQRTIGRVDFEFAGGLVVEVAGHGTHATRQQRQVDAQRHTELTLRGYRVVTFTFEDVRDRPDWIVARLREATQHAA